MTYKLTWLPPVLRAAGLEVLEYPGWQNIGHGDVGQVRGVLCHHTCGPVHGDLPDIDVLVHGRPDLGGPVCNIGLGRSGRYTMVAAGKGWHAGAGAWRGITDGNGQMIGIEAENTGEITGPRADTWPAVQMDAYRRGCAAIMKHIGGTADMVAGHKEYALPRGRKDDPDFDMTAFRADVSRIMGTIAPPLAAPPRARVGVAKVNDLNIRSNAGARSMIVGILNTGEKVNVLSESVNGSTVWYAVNKGGVPIPNTGAGILGYVSARYIDIQ